MATEGPTNGVSCGSPESSVAGGGGRRRSRWGSIVGFSNCFSWAVGPYRAPQGKGGSFRPYYCQGGFDLVLF